MNKQEREKLRKEVIEKARREGGNYYEPTICGLLDYIDALEEQVEALENIIPEWDKGFPTIVVRASWVMSIKPLGFRDWGCKQCLGESGLNVYDFICAFHRAERAIASA